MKYDDVLSVLGDFGRYQRVVYTLVCLPIAFVGMQLMSPVFILASPKHRCALPDWPNDTYEVQNDVHKSLINAWIPINDDDSDTYPSCDIYTRHVVPRGYSYVSTQAGLHIENASYSGTSLEHLGNITGKRECERHVFDRSVFKDSVITETDLVCARVIYRAHATTALNFGSIFSYIIIGQFSDRFGRKLATSILLLVMCVSSTALVWLPSIYVFIVIRLFIGFGFGVFFNCSFVYAMEFIGPSHRTTWGMFTNHIWAFGITFQALLAYGFRSWRHLQLATSLPIYLFFIYWWKLPNPVKWLMANGRVEESQAVIKKMAEVNKVILKPEELDIQLENDTAKENQGFNILELFRHKELAIRCLIVFYNWFVVAMLYYGLSLNVGNLGGDIYINFAISSGVELIAYSICIPGMSRFGRTKFQSGCMIAGGIVLLLTIIPESLNFSSVLLVTSMAMLGKLISSAAYGSIYLYSAELFPTVIRSTAMGLASACATIGALVAPYIVELANLLKGNSAKITPLIIFGATSLLAGLLALRLPETNRNRLPDTIDDIKKSKRNVNDAKAGDVI